MSAGGPEPGRTALAGALAKRPWVLPALAALIAALTLPRTLGAATWQSLASLQLDRAQLAAGLTRDARADLATRAGQAAQRALAANPAYAPPYETLGAIYADWGDAAAAAEAFGAALARDPEDEVTAFQRGHALAALGEEAAARAAWRQAGAVLYFAQQADALRGSDPEAAQLSAERAIAVDPARVEGYLALGRVLTAREAYTEALAIYQEGLETGDAPEARAELYLELGRLLARHLDREDAALQALEEAVTLDPESATARLEAAAIAAGRGACYDAATWLSPLLEAPPEASAAVRARVVVGRCHLDQGRPQSALPFLQEAVRGQDATGKAPSVANLLLLAEAYRAAGRDGNARTTYEWVLRLQPDHAGARAALAALGRTAPSE